MLVFVRTACHFKYPSLNEYEHAFKHREKRDSIKTEERRLKIAGEMIWNE